MPKDEFGNGNGNDHFNELASLQRMDKEIGAEIDRTPNCHPEMAGEGIKYIWEKAKQWYKSFFAEDKKGIEKFHLLVQLSLAQNNEGARISKKRV